MAVDVPAPMRSRLWEAGWYVKEAYRLYPPADTDLGYESELLFLGTERTAMSRQMRPLTAYVPNAEGGTVIVGEDW